MGQAYLQADDYAFLYDVDGDILKGSHIQNTVENNPIIANEDADLVTNFVQRGFNVDRSKIFKNGSFVIDKTQGVIQFSSSVTGRTIVLDYLSDGLFQRTDSEIKIPTYPESLYTHLSISVLSKEKDLYLKERNKEQKQIGIIKED